MSSKHKHGHKHERKHGDKPIAMVEQRSAMALWLTIIAVAFILVGLLIFAYYMIFG